MVSEFNMADSNRQAIRGLYLWSTVGNLSTYKPADLLTWQKNLMKDSLVFPGWKCDEAFPLSHHLQIHMKTHTGEKHYGCEECRSKFARKLHKQVHMKKHTEEKTFKLRGMWLSIWQWFKFWEKFVGTVSDLILRPISIQITNDSA